MFFRGRGYVYLAERFSDGTKGPNSITLCTDSLNLDFGSTEIVHRNRCAPGDLVDRRDSKDQTASLTLTLADISDRNLALGVVATVTPAASGSVTNEQLPDGILAGYVHFLGDGNQNISALTIDGLVLNTDYTLDAVSGKVTFLTDVGSPAPMADYAFSNAARVKFFSSARKEYWLTYDFQNTADENAPGLYNFYKVSFDPSSNNDLQSEDYQTMTLNGSVLADTTRLSNDRFGERIGGASINP